MSDIRIEAPELAAMAKRYAEAETVIREEMMRGVENAAKAGVMYARPLVPVKTGHLRRSLTATKATYAGGTATAMYGTNVPYAKWVEEGTGPHTITAKRGRALSFVWKGKRVAFRSVRHPGTKGRRYMKGSRDMLEPQLNTEFRAVIVRILRRLGG